MSDIQTFCDSNGDIVGYALAAHTATVDPVTCTPVFGLQANYYDTDWVSLGSSLPAGWELCCCGGDETVTTLTKNGLLNTATYTNEVGATTVLTETDFTDNSQIIPATCEGVLADASVLRELPTRYDTATQTYRVFDDGATTAVVFESAWNGTGNPGGTVLPTGFTFSTPVSVIIINNPSSCRSMVVKKDVQSVSNIASTDNVNVVTSRMDGYFDNGTGSYSLDSQPRLSAWSNGQPFYNTVSGFNRASPSVIPPGGSHTYRSYADLTVEQGNTAPSSMDVSMGYGAINGIGVTQ